MNLILLLFVACLLLVQPLVAQPLTGHVVLKGSQLPVPHAHITCPESGEATMTDEKGYFELKLNDISKAKTLAASFVGYKTTALPVLRSTQHYLFELTEDTTRLKEVVIRSPDPVELLRQAIKNLDANHGGKRVLTCFYRMVTRNQEKYIQLSEASFELNQGHEVRQIRLLKAREAEDKKAFNGVGMGIGTPVSAARDIDITQATHETFLDKRGLKKHTFFYEGISHRNDVEVHEISFDQKKMKQALYRGKIYLHTGSLAFVAIEYELSPKGIPYFKIGNALERAALKLLNIDIDLTAMRTSLDYRPYGNKWHLHYVLHEEDVRVKSKRYNFDVPVTDRSEYLVTRIDTTRQEPFPKMKYKAETSLESAGDTTSAFWKTYNIIPTTINYDAIAQQIETRNGDALTKEAIQAKLNSLPKDPALRVDSVLSYYHKKGLFNGQVLVKHKGKMIVHRGYGYADKEQQIMNDTTTVFRIGSIAKTFTSRIIWELEKDNLLEYNDSLQRFLPWYPHKGITIHHLLTHTSGIPNYTEQASYIDSIQYPFPLEQLVRRFGVATPYFAAGTDFRYSNTGYTILALIAEKASGKSSGMLFSERIASPLGLANTTFADPTHPHMAKGYWNATPEPYYAISNTTGAGAICSSASDLLKWDEAQNDPRLTILFQPREWYSDWGSYYGYGWNIDKYQFAVSKKHTVQYHGGTDFGFKSMMARQPDKDNLVILLNNTGEFPLFSITDLILTILN